jgi:putative hydrolase of the HAD superfamily
MPIRAIAFDLDDTLMDTSGILAPRAALNAFQILIDAGLKLTLDQCEEKRTQMIKNVSHKDVFATLAKDHGTAETLNVLDLANKAFYEPHLQNQLPLLEGARQNIDQLKNNYSLYIVTAGYESAQNQKVKALGIQRDFKKVFVVNSLEKERKFGAFQKILELENIQPHELLCIGNSLSSEIKDAKILGAVACYFEFGEDRGVVSNNPAEKPDYHVKHHFDVIPTCKLKI